MADEEREDACVQMNKSRGEKVGKLQIPLFVSWWKSFPFFMSEIFLSLPECSEQEAKGELNERNKEDS